MLPRGIRRLFRLFRGHGDVEEDLDAEIAFHLDAKTEALIASGLKPPAAREEALRQFGDLRRSRRELAAIDHRDAGRRLRTDRLEAVWSDLRFAARGLARSPGFTAVVVITLTLGLGATAAMFGVLDRLLLRAPIGVRDPGQVVRLYVSRSKADEMFGRVRWEFLYPELESFERAGPAAAVAFATHGPNPAAIADDAGQIQAWATLVSGGYFKVLGASSVLGRPLQPSDDSAGSPPAAVVSFALWKGRYGGSPSVVGRVIRVKGRAYTVVGVAPQGFSGLSPREVDLWLPASVAGDDLFGRPTKWFDWRRGHFGFDAIARFAPGRTRQEVVGGLTLAFRRGQALRPADFTGPADSGATIVVGSILPGRSQLEIGRLGESVSLSFLVGAVALVVCLIAMANVADLLLLRSLARRRETSIRLALGVSRWRLVRAILSESLLMAALAAAAAAVVSWVGSRLLQGLLFGESWAAPLFGVRVFAFVALAAFAVGAITGLAPAFFGGRPDVVASLKAGIPLTGWRRSRLRATLVAGQMALTLVLLAGLGLFARSLERAERVDFGADMHHLVMVSPMRSASSVSAGQLDLLLSRARRLPGVRAAAFASTAIPMYSFTVRFLRAEGVASLPLSSAAGGPFFSAIGPGYFETTGLVLRRGREFAASEYTAPATVALVSEEMTRRLWPRQDAIGKCLYVKVNMVGDAQPPCSVIVGIVASVRQDVSEPPLMQYYLPLPSDAAAAYPDIVVRTDGDPDRVVRPLTALAKTMVPDLPDGSVRTIASIIDRQLHAWKLASELLAMFAALALVVAAVGVYSVVAFDAVQRRGEFGIRVALGARGWDLARLLFGQGLRYGAIGLLVGLGLVVAAGRYLGPQLFHTSPRDPMVLAAVGALLLIAAGAACIVPARSAARADPRVSLQAE